MENNLDYTQHYRIPKEELLTVEEVFERVYQALAEKGYDPVNQIVGYIMSGDPTYITSHNNARGIIAKVERDELIEEAIRFYIDNKLK
ncbi:MAG: IreB family regulatory phosphoprotein [Lachnospiraceae bacterium]|nr:IreB family regulatory phosphoprotein [Lachnospiraceae bacterium]